MKINSYFEKNEKGEIVEVPILQSKKTEINKNMSIIGTKGRSVNIRYDENGNRYINGELRNN